MEVVRTAKVGKDGFPLFTMAMNADTQDKVAALRTRFEAAKKILNNTSPEAIGRMSSDATKENAKKRHADALETKVKVLQEASEMYFNVVDDAAMAQNFPQDDPDRRGPPGHGAPPALTMDFVKNMCVAAASMALAQQPTQQPTQQPLAIADTEVTQRLDRIESGVTDLCGLAVSKYIADNEEEVREDAIQRAADEISSDEALDKKIESIDPTEALNHAAEAWFTKDYVTDKAVDKLIDTWDTQYKIKAAMRAESFEEALDESDEELILSLANGIKRRRGESSSSSSSISKEETKRRRDAMMAANYSMMMRSKERGAMLSIK